MHGRVCLNMFVLCVHLRVFACVLVRVLICLVLICVLMCVLNMYLSVRVCVNSNRLSLLLVYFRKGQFIIFIRNCFVLNFFLNLILYTCKTQYIASCSARQRSAKSIGKPIFFFFTVLRFM